MAHHISAVIGNASLTAKVVALSGSPFLAMLKENLCIVGFLGEQIRALAGTDFNICAPGFEHLNRDLQGRLADVSRRGDLVYLETEYFGGVGTQAAAFFSKGRLVWSRHETSDVPANSNSPINAALREIGVMAKAGVDEFDTVGLGHLRAVSHFGRSQI